MGNQDRLSIVGFNEEINAVCRLTSCTNTGKQTLYQIASGLQTGGCTSIQTALETAISILLNRSLKNSSSYILLLSDGNENLSVPPMQRDIGMDKLKIHCFCIGQRVNEVLLKRLAANYNGVYQRIHTDLNVKWAIEQAFDMLSPATVKQIKVDFSPGDRSLPCKAIQLGLHSDAYFPRFDLPSGSQAKLLFLLLPQPAQALQLPLSLRPLIVTVSYLVDGLESASLEVPLQVSFIEWSDAPPSKVERVYVHFYCEKGKKALEEARRLVKAGRRLEARQRLEGEIGFLGEDTKSMEESAELDQMKKWLECEKSRLE
jgi:hypothetical protein